MELLEGKEDIELNPHCPRTNINISIFVIYSPWINKRKNEKSSFTYAEKINVYKAYVKVVLKRMHRCVPTVRDMCILFNEQVIC